MTEEKKNYQCIECGEIFHENNFDDIILLRCKKCFGYQLFPPPPTPHSSLSSSESSSSSSSRNLYSGSGSRNIGIGRRVGSMSGVRAPAQVLSATQPEFRDPLHSDRHTRIILWVGCTFITIVLIASITAIIGGWNGF